MRVSSREAGHFPGGGGAWGLQGLEGPVVVHQKGEGRSCAALGIQGKEVMSSYGTSCGSTLELLAAGTGSGGVAKKRVTRKENGRSLRLATASPSCADGKEGLKSY